MLDFASRLESRLCGTMLSDTYLTRVPTQPRDRPELLSSGGSGAVPVLTETHKLKQHGSH